MLEPAVCAALQRATGRAQHFDEAETSTAAVPDTNRVAVVMCTRVTASLLSAAASFVSLPQSQPAAADAPIQAPSAVAAEGCARKKRKDSKASSAEQPDGHRDAVMPISCMATVREDTDIAISLLFSACRRPICRPNVQAAALQQPATLGELLAACEAAVIPADGIGDGEQVVAQLPHDVTVRLLRYLETIDAVIVAGGHRESPHQQTADSFNAMQAASTVHSAEMAGIVLIHLVLVTV